MKASTSVLHSSPRQGFTLIELLVVIAIIAILAVVVVLTLNPAQLLAQSRDANRVSDMATMQSAINLYNTDQAGASSYSLGTASTSYLSLPSASSSCATLGMATSAYSYACSTSANYHNVNTTGWLPVNLTQISAGSPISSLPVDPVNQTSSNLYYSYETNGSQYALSAFLESSKYAKQMETSGGIDPALYEAGSGAATLPDATRGLVGYWPLDEGSGSTAYDWSGEGNNESWQGTPAGSSTYYSPGYLYPWAGYFNGSNDYISVPPSDFNPAQGTWAAWINVTTSTNAIRVFTSMDSRGSNYQFRTYWLSTVGFYFAVGNGTTTPGSSAFPIQFGQWQHIAFSWQYNATTGMTALMTYNNGALVGSISFTGQIVAPNTNIEIGAWNGANNYDGLISDFRLYDRVLSASEIQELYNAEK